MYTRLAKLVRALLGKTLGYVIVARLVGFGRITRRARVFKCSIRLPDWKVKDPGNQDRKNESLNNQGDDLK